MFGGANKLLMSKDFNHKLTYKPIVFTNENVPLKSSKTFELWLLFYIINNGQHIAWVIT